MRATSPNDRIWKVYGFRMEWAPNFRGTCRITWILETADNGNHIYAAELLEVRSGDQGLWTWGILESELEQ